MFKIFRRKSDNLEQVTEKELKENKAVIESLRDYDAGKKEISTARVKRHMSNL